MQQTFTLDEIRRAAKIIAKVNIEMNRFDEAIGALQLLQELERRALDRLVYTNGLSRPEKESTQDEAQAH